MNIKNRTCYFFDDIINIKEFNENNIKINKKSYKNILLCYMEYVTIKKDLKTYNVNPLYLISGKFNGYFEEINGNRYLTLVPNNKAKKKKKEYK